MSISKTLNAFRFLNIKTVYFNFKYLPFRQAIKLPFYISCRTHLLKTNGKIHIHSPVKPGMIRIGYGMVGIFDKRIRAIWEVNGNIHFHGTAIMKFGSKISVGPEGELHIGNEFRFTTNSTIICNKEIRFGDGVRVSWESIIMDTDFHTIETLDGKKINHDKKIEIGNNVWIGMRCSIMKGAKLDDNVVLGSNSLLNKYIPGTNQIVAGNPAQVVKTKIRWQE